jgi:Flp pilus assembly protein TadD
LALRDGRYSEAVDFAQRGLQTEKKNPFLYYHLGQAHRLDAMKAPRSARKTRLEQAEKSFRKGLVLFPQDEDLWIRLGQTLDALGDYKNARDAYECALQLDPNLGILYAYYAKHLISAGRESEAEEILAKGQQLTSQNLSTFLNGPLQAPNAPAEQPR